MDEAVGLLLYGFGNRHKPFPLSARAALTRVVLFAESLKLVHS